MGDGAVNRAIFLDRDGVLNDAIIVDGRPYPPATIEQVHVSAGAREALDVFHGLGFLCIVITNQPDIARGRTTYAFVDQIHGILRSTLPIDDILVCHHDESDRCSCRKPLPGMIREAASHHKINLTRSYCIGDRWRDVAAGQAAGVTTIFIDHGYSERRPEPAADAEARDILEAADWIRERELRSQDSLGWPEKP